MKSIRAGLLLGSACIFSLSGCATPSEQAGGSGSVGSTVVSYFDNPAACSNNDAVIGTVGTAIIGAGLGYLTGGERGAIIGAAAGAGTGLLIGHLIDDRRCQLYKIAEANQLQIASTPIPNSAIGNSQPGAADKNVGLNVVVADDGTQFSPGSATLSPGAQAAYSQIGELYAPANITGANPTPDQVAEANQRAVLIVVHATPTDAETGQNLTELTQERARTVAQSLESSGVDPNNIYYQGVGDAAPVASNDSTDGQAAESSVQILDVPKSSDLPELLANQATLPPASVEAGAASPGTESSEMTDAAYNFGGSPVSGDAATVALGPPINSSWSFISSANAATPLQVPACTVDQPRKVAAVTNLATGEALPIRDDLPGFYGAPWAGGLNGNLVDILDDVVPAEVGSPVPEPKLQVYRNYHNGDNIPNFSHNVAVNVYRSQTQTLYRVFLHGSARPMQCMDLMVPSGANTGTGTVYYYHDHQLYTASGSFSLQ